MFKKLLFLLLFLSSIHVIAQQILESGIQTLRLTGCQLKNTSIEITGTGNIINNRASSPSETAVEEIDINVDLSVSSTDTSGSFRFGIGKQATLAGTYIEFKGDGRKSSVIVNRMDGSRLYPVKEYELPFNLKSGKTFKIRVGKRVRQLVVELSAEQGHFLIDSLEFPSPFFGCLWGVPFIACSAGTLSIFSYSLSTPFVLNPRLLVIGDSFIEANSLEKISDRYISFMKDSIGHENIAILGKAGENSSSVKSRFKTETTWFAGSDYALLALGTNDINLATWKTNMTAYIQELKKKGMIPILTTLCPRDDRNTFIKEANKWIRNEYNGAYIDINKLVATDDVNWLPGTSLPDRIHPSPQSHKTIFYNFAETAPYLFRNKKKYSIDFINETTVENISADYSTHADFSSLQSGNKQKIGLIPGNDLFFKDPDPNKTSIHDILLVPERPRHLLILTYMLTVLSTGPSLPVLIVKVIMNILPIRALPGSHALKSL